VLVNILVITHSVQKFWGQYGVRKHFLKICPRREQGEIKVNIITSKKKEYDTKQNARESHQQINNSTKLIN
jgi:hypothetical protein